MPRIELSLTANYCPDWGLFSGVREIIQNAIDDQEFNGGKMVVEHLPRSDKLVVTSENVKLDHSVLLLGESSKTGDERGRFGEGFNIGTLALVRAGHAVTIYNGDEVWRPVLEPSENYAGKTVLCFQTRKLKKSRDHFTVEIENISRPVWDALKRKFLFLSPPRECDIIKVDKGTLLLHPDYKGEIYVKGIYVNDVKDFACGYDLKSFKLDRDRQLMDTWDLKWTLGSLWVAAQTADPDRAAARLYDMTEKGTADAEHLHHHADNKLVAAMQRTLEETHGAGVMPVKDSADLKRLESIGIKAVIVKRSLHEVLVKNLPTVEEIITKAEAGIKADYQPAALTSAEMEGFFLAERVFGLQTQPEFRIVDFNDEKATVRYDKESESLCVARAALVLHRRDLLRQLAKAEAIRRMVDDGEVYLDLLIHLFHDIGVLRQTRLAERMGA